MKTVILPGYSPSNYDWALEIKKDLNLNHDVLVHQWPHWSEGSFSLPREIKALLAIIGEEKVNIIAKSVGTRVAMTLVPKIPKQINKVILCGIPTKGKTETAKRTYSMGLSALSPIQVIVFQNRSDPFANYEVIKKFIGSINPKIRMVEKPRSDHHYPYSTEFQKFLERK